jgi:carbon monoxide dehydrogenase subunit G
MKLRFSGAPEIATTRDHVWQRLLDPNFVARSAPGIESVQPLDPTHFKVVSGFGVGAVKLRFTLDVELFDVVEGERLKMRARGKAPGSNVDVTASMHLEEPSPGQVRLNWVADNDVSGTVASVGARLLEGTSKKLIEQFWTDFARRVQEEAGHR